MHQRTSSDWTSAARFQPKFQPKPGPMQRCRCCYSGRVQGVGFRYTTKNIAMRFDVSGYVKNLPDGRVELIVEGPPPQIEEMIRSVATRMSDYIREVENSILPATGEFSQFQIKH